VSSGPALTVVVVTRDEYRPLRPIVASLQRQSIAHQLELVVVAPRERNVAIPPTDAGAFHSARVVTVGSVVSRGRAAAQGVLSATAPIVALTENHCFPEPTWAERILAGHRGPWAAVGPAVANANPGTVVSQAIHAFGYGAFPRSRPAGDASELPQHNSSYRRDALPTGVELEDLLADEAALHRVLVQRGLGLRFEPGPVKWHINETTWDQLVALAYVSGRRYGGARARGWPTWKRLVYAAAFPILSLPIAKSIWNKARPEEGAGKGLSLALVVWIIGLLHAAGEAMSYLIGGGDKFPSLENQEFLITERLAGKPVGQPEVARLLALLTDPEARA
jgi:hypothetical protein